MSREEAESAYEAARERHEAAYEDLLSAKRELDSYIREEEVEKQAVFFGISEEEARERIEQNAQERAEDKPRTIWPEPVGGE